MELRTLLPLTPGTLIVRHETPIVRKTMNAVKTRRSDSLARCYKELIVADVVYQKAALYGRTLRVQLLDFIRAEMKFAGLDQLKAQIASDGQAARGLLA